MMNIWPKFWEHIPEKDRASIRAIVAEVLSTGVLFGEMGRERELFLVAREYQAELAEYLSVAGLELFADPDRAIFQARPIPGECGLLARFSKDETLVALTLWRIYDEMRMEQTSEAIVITANDLDARLKLYFETVIPPTETHLERMLTKFRQRRFIRFQKDDLKLGESRIEILPTLARAIPFDTAADWAEHVNLFAVSGDGQAESETNDSSDLNDPSEESPLDPTEALFEQNPEA